ncbi:MAG: iron ABC transporter permease [Sphaerochaetaceae bacterium]|nr:iron ABC transporter permease [Sphaerochaetaceae bacterium]
MLFSLCVGRMVIPVPLIISSVLSKIGIGDPASSAIEKVLWNIRLPRIILASLAGIGLSLAGLSFQSLFANPLATPDTLGVASGSSFGACLGILMGFSLRGIQLMALALGLVAVSITWVCGRQKGRGTTTIVLSGIIIGSLFNALVSLVKYVADTETQLPSITYWLMGSMSGKGYSTLTIGSPLIVLGIVLLFLMRWRLNILPLSDDEAKASGTDIKKLRIAVIVIATALTASCVSMCGQIGWVGLIVPHICRMALGNSHEKLVPSSISIGATFLVVVDTMSRTIATSEIPISVLTALLGAPFFIVLMKKNGGWTL